MKTTNNNQNNAIAKKKSSGTQKVVLIVLAGWIMTFVTIHVIEYYTGIEIITSTAPY
ncbi:MAG: hypothetical protein IIA45_15275 [Bacteroidetes bacterium]|nr:hypothetical protein [Bacteroidota bacterium]